MVFRAVARSTLMAQLRRAIITSLVVGTTLLLINHGDHITREPICPHFWFKCGLCYAVPFCVSLVSAVLATRSPGS